MPALYREIASLVTARHNCIKLNNHNWLTNHEKAILDLVKDTAPSGSGIDCGTKIDLDASTGEKLVFTCSYHHMNEHGMYDGWTEHTITVKPSLQWGFALSISGRNRNEIKDYLHEVYSNWLSSKAA